ncbi:MAG: T9SS type A sorting domain-containing protein [Dysgonamonadaceae bacterium]|jgi:uncharacterized membrane protein|nr:T9SS type A sorting domain-containing protein [Dysgonamonadaceae bacterium]
MKKTLLLNLLFLYLFSGTISAKEPINGNVSVESNQFFLIPGAGYPNRISPNGRYVAGSREGSFGFIFDTETQTLEVDTSDIRGSEAVDVNSDGIVCGTFRDPNLTIFIEDWETTGQKGFVPIKVAGIYQEGAWISLGIGNLDINTIRNPDEGSRANAISADGKTVGGFLNADEKVSPCTWTKNNDGTWTYNTYDYPDSDAEAQGAKILALSGDGRIAAGWAVVELGGSRLPIIWKSPTDYTIISTVASSMGISNISDNGKYATFTIENQAAIYYVEEDRYEIIPGHQGARSVEITAISDDGLIVGYSHFGDGGIGGWRYGFVYSGDLGFVDLANFIEVFAPDVQLSNINFREKHFSVPMDISADGKYITGWYGEGSLSALPWVLKLAKKPQAYKKPQNFKASVTKTNRVILTWDAPENSTFELTGYKIYRDNKLLTSITEPDTEIFEDTTLQNAAGVFIYNISAVYTQNESVNSDNVLAILADNYNIPFFEDFDSGDFATNHWYSDGWIIDTRISRGIYKYGVTSSKSVNISERKTLTSKSLDAATLDKVYLNFMVRCRQNEITVLKEDTLSVEVHNGSDWICVKRYTPDVLSSSLWKKESLDLSTQVAGKFFQIRFVFYGKDLDFYTIWDLDNIRVDSVQVKDTKGPSDLTGNLSGNKANIAWKTPNDVYELTYMKSNKIDKIGNGGNSFIAANSFKASDLAIYKGKYLSSLSIVINQDFPDEELKLALVVFLNGQKIINQPVQSFVSTAAWNTITLENPLLIDETINDLKIGIDIIKHAEKEQPIGTDYSGLPTPEGNLFSEDGGNTWLKLSNYTWDNWAIIGNLTNTNTDEIIPESDQNLLGYIIYRSDQNQNFTFMSRYTDDNASAGICYQISAYYKDGLETLPSETFCPVQTGIHSKEIEKSKIFPNPVSDYIRINGTFTKASLLDLNGKKLLETTQNSIPVSQIASGIYLLKIESGTQVTTCKIVKK